MMYDDYFHKTGACRRQYGNVVLSIALRNKRKWGGGRQIVAGVTDRIFKVERESMQR